MQRFNAIADHLVRIENFRTKTGEIRPAAMQERSMHINRILNVTAHQFASRETATRFSDFWYGSRTSCCELGEGAWRG